MVVLLLYDRGNLEPLNKLFWSMPRFHLKIISLCFDIDEKQVQQTKKANTILKITNHEYVDKLDTRVEFFGNTKKKIQTTVNFKFMTQI